MSTQGDMDVIGVVAGADLSAAQYKIVAVGGTIAATNLTALGVLLNKPQSGEAASVAYEGHVKVYAGAAIIAGAGLKVTTSGYAITATSGSGVFGKALDTVSSGSLVSALVDFTTAAAVF